MSRNLRSNSSAPPFFSIPNQLSIKMAVDGAGAGAVAPAVAAPVVIWNENPLTVNFNPVTVAGQKIFLEKKKVLATAGQLPLSNASATNIMEFSKMKGQLMGTVVTGVPTVYTARVGSSPINLK